AYTRLLLAAPLPAVVGGLRAFLLHRVVRQRAGLDLPAGRGADDAAGEDLHRQRVRGGSVHRGRLDHAHRAHRRRPRGGRALDRVPPLRLTRPEERGMPWPPPSQADSPTVSPSSPEPPTASAAPARCASPGRAPISRSCTARATP